MPIIEAEPYPFDLDTAHTGLVIIDMQRDFLEPRGFGAVLGNDVSLLRRTIAPTQRVLDAAHRAGLTVIHTREGHRPDLADLPPAKKVRGRLAAGIGDPGPMGRILFDQLERQQLAIVNHFKGTQLLPSPEPASCRHALRSSICSM